VTPEPIITLTTDFGADSPYVAAMKGVILAINPRARLVDLSHQIPPQDVRHAAFFLRFCIPFFPAGVIHVVVVDPGVGTDRALLYVEVEGHRLLAPDNGCWSELARGASRPPTVIRLTENRYWRNPLSATFHGRDILAPVAAHLSLGEDPQRLGHRVQQWVRLEIPSPIVEASRVIGEVIYVDHFGNLITNIPRAAFANLAPGPVRILVGDHEVTRRVQTYGEAPPGTLVALISSADLLEIAVTGGNAAERLGAAVGTVVTVQKA
jgi:S-adenosyl-L-methionine hydrolase (adenosine-forming)